MIAIRSVFARRHPRVAVWGGVFMDAAAEATGLSMGNKLQEALFGKLTRSDDASTSIGYHMIRTGGGQFTQIGEAIGEAIGTGITTALGRGFSSWWNNTFLPRVKSKLIPLALGEAGGPTGMLGFFQSSGAALSFGGGGTVPGPLGSPQLAIVHGGEEVRTPAQQAAGMGETNALLRQLLQLVASGQSSGGGPGAGTDAMISELMERIGNARRRGFVGAYVR